MVSVWRTRENGMSEPTPAAAVPETVVAFAIVALTVAGPSDASYSNAKTHRPQAVSVVTNKSRLIWPEPQAAS